MISLVWLAEQNTKPLHTYLKPHPVHALAALQAAVGTPITKALEIALNLVNGSGDISDWRVFQDTTIYTFEDSTGGLLSAKDAEQILGKIGIHPQVHLIGVSDNPTKTKALTKIAGKVIADISQELLQITK